ncbi:monoglyceride lipase [Caerostris darwini]|uniref:Monoglyceride lipase n=1 Tax=Caerostris darwini TaxID=1538125 RepID=A0AAV4P8F1_9ARAC|nr:monoglyceride lipase [Caerostris darwini]
MSMNSGHSRRTFGGDSMLFEDHFRNLRNQKIACYYWEPTEEPRALLLISHGMTEHTMVYDDIAQEMVQKGFFVFGHDHVGHGRSDGPRALINDVHELVEDSLMHIQRIRKQYPNLPLFLCGHSMGGAVAVFLAFQVPVNGMALIAPALAVNPETATFFTVTVSKLMSKFFHGSRWLQRIILLQLGIKIL